MTRNRLPRILNLPLLLLLLTGCGHPVQETAAHKIADALPTLLGPAAHYEVQVDGEPLALSRGRARAVHFQGEDVQLSPSLIVNTLSADVSDVSFDRDSKRLEHVGSAKFAATLDQTHLRAYLSHAKSRFPGIIVTLRPDDVLADVPVTFLGLQTTASLTGTLAPDTGDPSKLDFVANGARVGGIPLPAGLVNLALDELNPLVTLTGLRVPLTIRSATISNSRLSLQGTADLSGLIQAQ